MRAKVALGLAVCWAIFTVVAMFIGPVRESVPVIFFLSGYAIVVSHLAEWAAHRAEESNDG